MVAPKSTHCRQCARSSSVSPRIPSEHGTRINTGTREQCRMRRACWVIDAVHAACAAATPAASPDSRCGNPRGSART